MNGNLGVDIMQKLYAQPKHAKIAEKKEVLDEKLILLGTKFIFQCENIWQNIIVFEISAKIFAGTKPKIQYI